MSYRGRFAPSPTGALHFGSLVAALASWLRARGAGGTWVVRIEDIDRARTQPGCAERLLDTLAAFGMRSDEPVLRQSQRDAVYADALAELVARELAYPCACSRADLQPFHGIHPPTCVRDPAMRPRPAWRLRVPQRVIGFHDAVYGEFEPSLHADIGDFVLRRSDGDWSYQLAVVVDDHAQRINEVVRGADLIDSTPRQILLHELLGSTAPQWLHVPLVVDAQGRKLGKRDRAYPIDPADPLPALRAALEFLGQRVPSEHTVAGLLDAAAVAFDLHRISPRMPPHAAMQKD